MPSLVRLLRRSPATLAVAAVIVGSLAEPSRADNVFPEPVQPPDSPPSNVIASEVHYKRSYNGAGSKMAPPQGAAWRPPACWYEPKYTGEQFESYLNSHYVSSENAFADMAQRYGADDYHKGQDGAWWELEIPDLSRAGECAGLEPYAWFPPARHPDPKVSAADPRTLAGLAYADTVLPPPQVTLRPPRTQLVNLGTEVAFTLPMDRVTVTASLDNAALGIHVAATTIAEPYELRVDAGTPDADPATCTYRLTADGGAYHLDTHGAPCNVTYRKVSPPGGYAVTATVVWKVHWTPSDNPDGPAAAPPMPDGESAAPPATVTVRESQSVVR
ncbi:MAG: hypothetical protein HOY69_39955 [Streptomyces sp.]|nr:hypothetical protein [Streptomyces sp.]